MQGSKTTNDKLTRGIIKEKEPWAAHLPTSSDTWSSPKNKNVRTLNRPIGPLEATTSNQETNSLESQEAYIQNSKT